MFEEEAEEYAGNREVCDLLDAISEDLQNYDYGTVAHYNIDPLVEECFKDGADFGFNKANEWHYVKDGNPNNENDILCQISKDEVVVGYYHTVAKRYFTIDGQDLYNVIAWKEIVFPKEIKENEKE